VLPNWQKVQKGLFLWWVWLWIWLFLCSFYYELLCFIYSDLN
jgi:hypothetical protein